MPLFHELNHEAQIDALLEVADKIGLSPQIVEKDYWVCLTLKILFDSTAFAPFLCFRGGTALSKVYGYIQRFSEDIDVSLSSSCFPQILPNMLPCLTESQGQRDTKQSNIRKLYRSMIKTELLPLLQREFLRFGAKNIQLEPANLETARDPWVVLIHYPTCVAEGKASYITPVVKLELSGREQSEPHETKQIDSLLSEVFPSLAKPIDIHAVCPTRTFWEKAFLLHEENVRARPINSRLSRHYYDLGALIRHKAIDFSIFNMVKEHRQLYYGYTSVDYNEITPSNLILLPNTAEKLVIWRRDYEAMLPMLFGNPPTFSELLTTIETEQQTWKSRDFNK